MANRNVYFSVPVDQPCFGFAKMAGRWTQVQIIRALYEPDGVIKNLITSPLGQTLIVDCRKIRYRHMRAEYVPHPEASKYHV